MFEILSECLISPFIIVGRGVLTLFYEDPTYIANPHFSNFVQPPFPVASNPNPTVLSVVLFLWLNG